MGYPSSPTTASCTSGWGRAGRSEKLEGGRMHRALWYHHGVDQRGGAHDGDLSAVARSMTAL